MNNKDFISALAQKARFTVRTTQQLVDAFTTELTAQLDDGNQVVVPGFGIFDVKKKMERIFVSPSTGQTLMSPPKLVVNFRPSSTLKEQVQQKGGSKA